MTDVNTLAKWKAFGRLVNALHSIHIAGHEMDTASIEQMITRVEGLIDPFRGYNEGDSVEVLGHDDEWFPGTVIARHGGIAAPELTILVKSSGVWRRAPGEDRLRRPS